MSSSELKASIPCDDPGDNESLWSFESSEELVEDNFMYVKFQPKTTAVFYVGNVVEKTSNSEYYVKYLRLEILIHFVFFKQRVHKAAKNQIFMTVLPGSLNLEEIQR